MKSKFSNYNIIWEKPKAMQHVAISPQVDRLLYKSEDAYL